MDAVPRELFVGEPQAARAYDNVALPIDCGQTISQPLVVARMLALLELGPADRVLDVGTGSGYHAALLGRLAGRVWTIERHGPLVERARAALRAAGADNVVCGHGDGRRGWPEAAPFDAINVAAAPAASVPGALRASTGRRRPADRPRGAHRAAPRAPAPLRAARAHRAP